MDEAGVAHGLYPEILREIAKKEKWTLEFQLNTWAENLERLEKVQIDLMVSIVFSSRRDQVFDFSQEPVVTAWGQVYANEGTKILSILDLEGKRVSIMEKDINAKHLMELCKKFNVRCQFIKANTYDEVCEDILNEKADAGVINNINGEFLKRKYNIFSTPIMFSPVRAVFASPEGKNDHLLQVIDSTLSSWRQNPDSVYYSILNKWIGEVSSGSIPYKVFLIPFLIAISIFSVLLIWIATLQYQIKQRKKAESALKDDQEKFRSLSDAAFEGIAISAEGEIIEANNTMAEMFGYAMTEIIGINATDLAAPEYRKEVKKAVISGHDKPWQLSGITKEGAIFPIEVRAKKFQYKGRTVRVTAIRNLTEQKKAEDEVKILRGLIPICSHCKNIRDDQGYWQQIEDYLLDFSDARFSHGICPICAKKHYPDFDIYKD